MPNILKAMKTQIENSDFNQLQSTLINLGWTCEEIESTDFWTTFETDCEEGTLENIINNL